MPGKVLKVTVKAGDEVKAGDVLMVTEAMKMETNIKAKADGKIADVKFKEGIRWRKRTSSSSWGSVRDEKRPSAALLLG